MNHPLLRSLTRAIQVILYSFLSFTAAAQCLPPVNPAPADLDSCFTEAGGTGFQPTDYLAAITILANHKILVGGSFTRFNGSAANNVIQLNEDGSRDSTFLAVGNSFNGDILIIFSQPDGKLLVAGGFDNLFTINRLGIRRLNSDGSVDASFNVHNIAGSFYSVLCLALQPDGKIIVGGDFTLNQGVGHSYLIRLNADGNLDRSFNLMGGFTVSGHPGNSTYVKSIALQPDGKILVGGLFDTFNGTRVGHMVRLTSSGSLDTTFNVGNGFYGGSYDAPKQIIILPDNKLLVSGRFDSVDGHQSTNLVRLLSDGAFDTAFRIDGNFRNNTSPGIGVFPMILQSDNKIIAGGSFNHFGSYLRNHIVRLWSDGSLDTTFNPGTGFSNDVECLAMQSDGKLLAGGFFNSYRTSTAKLVRLYTGSSPLEVKVKAITKLLLYPNPALNIITFNGLQQYSIEAIATNGKHFNLNLVGESANITHLPPGLYTIQAGQQRCRFVKL